VRPRRVCVLIERLGNRRRPWKVSGDLVIQKVRTSLPNADSCTVSFSAQLHASGALEIEVLGNSRI
jgi:hypothetical protein